MTTAAWIFLATIWTMIIGACVASLKTILKSQ